MRDPWRYANHNKTKAQKSRETPPPDRAEKRRLHLSQPPHKTVIIPPVLKKIDRVRIEIGEESCCFGCGQTRILIGSIKTHRKEG